jgi:hypothetical protein
MLYRRSFLQMGGMAALSPSLAIAADDVPPALRRPMRWAQLVFVEDDPGNYDRSSGSITSSAFMQTAPASARADTWLSIRARCRCIT